MDPLPSISVQTSTSSPIFDLSKHDTFVITLTLSLHYSHSITFDKRWAGLFNGKLLYEGGLTFTDTTTGANVPRNTIDICYRSSHGDGNILDDAKGRLISLHPGEDYVLTATFKPISRQPTLETHSVKKGCIQETESSPPNVWKWYGVAGMKDGHTYQISIGDDAVIGEWMQGDLNGLLAMQNLGLRPTMKREVVRYIIPTSTSTSFEIRRPDEDGGLNWP